ncbi:MAG: bifunctional 3,4-dihydroxy-2-butanone-4-phosphate synthase/GTP cyclohydrolase II [bacterium]|nr:bifunctional 3,4-dihydroxy-2-butanone-4-phosphate synthase/GTP cyclohydrolase II [bacterium]
MVILLDDADRENEGDIVCAAELCTPELVNFMKKHARGLICTPMSGERLSKLALPLMTSNNTSNRSTAFTISVDAAHETTTGISAHDMAKTINVLADPGATPDELLRPGHIFPLRSDDGGVLRRRGQTEGSVDLMRIAGLEPVAVVCEIVHEDGTMAREPELLRFAEDYELPLLHVADVARYRLLRELLIERTAPADLPTVHGDFQMVGYEVPLTGEHHIALVYGEIDPNEPVLVRIHSECLTGDALGSTRCDCGQQLSWAMQAIAAEGRGILLYLRQEGRGIGLINKVRAYRLQDQGMDTVEANLALGLPADNRDYSIGAQILRDLGARRLRLITNNPQKLAGMEAFGLEVTERVPVPLDVMYHARNAQYLSTKVERMGHLIDFSLDPTQDDAVVCNAWRWG